jgi:hypothetical protein
MLVVKVLSLGKLILDECREGIKSNCTWIIFNANKDTSRLYLYFTFTLISSQSLIILIDTVLARLGRLITINCKFAVASLNNYDISLNIFEILQMKRKTKSTSANVVTQRISSYAVHGVSED